MTAVSENGIITLSVGTWGKNELGFVCQVTQRRGYETQERKGVSP